MASDGTTTQQQWFLKGNKLRFEEAGSGAEKGAMIFDAKKKVMYSLQHDEKVYMEPRRPVVQGHSGWDGQCGRKVSIERIIATQFQAMMYTPCVKPLLSESLTVDMRMSRVRSRLLSSARCFSLSMRSAGRPQAAIGATAKRRPKPHMVSCGNAGRVVSIL